MNARNSILSAVMLSLVAIATPAKAVTYQLIGGSADNIFASSIIVATQQQIQWRGSIPPVIAFQDSPPIPISRVESPAGIWSVQNNGNTTFTTTSGVVMLDGRTSTYQMTVLPGPPSNIPGFTFPSDYNLFSAFTDAYIDPLLVGGHVTANTWRGHIIVSFLNTLPAGNISFNANSGPQVVALPEPSPFALLVFGLSGLTTIKFMLTSRGR